MTTRSPWPRISVALAATAALHLAACGGGGGAGSARSATAALSPAASTVGHVPGAPEGTVVHLVAPGAADPAGGLLGYAQAIVATVDVDADGAFPLSSEDAALPAPSEGLVSAPGFALLRAPLAAFAAGEAGPLVPEAVIEARLAGPDGEPEVDAVALVLGADGAPLAIPAETLATGAEGALRATRLPAGDYTLVVGSADGLRHAVARVAVAAGAVARVGLRLEVDPEAEQRFAEVALGTRGPGADEEVGP